MKLHIHRGTKQIGGMCIEVEAQGKRLALNIGLGGAHHPLAHHPH